jgi:peptidylprolyl isomerase
MKLMFGLVALLLATAPAQAANRPAPPPAAPLVPLAPTAADWRPVDAANTLMIETNKGLIFVELYPTVAPAAVERLKKLTRARFYDGLTFFRVIDDFMAQTGDPKNTGTGQSGEPNLPPEFTFRLGPAAGFTAIDRPPGAEGGFIGALPVASQPAAMAALTADGKVQAYGVFCAGVLGMARADPPDSANSQFFLMRQEHLNLSQQYTPAGRVVAGEGVVRSIKVGEPPAPPQDAMLRVQVLADLPEATRPKVRVIDTKSPYFAALAKSALDDRGDRFTPCDVEVAGVVY